jgi:long-chain acyl-CoA synthetase
MGKAASVPWKPWPNLCAMMFDRARLWPDRPLHRTWRDGAWVSTDWTRYAREAAALARFLRANGLERGDRVLMVSENRPEFASADLGIMAAGGIAVPTYVTNTEADHAHILRDSGARIAIVSSLSLRGKVQAAARDTGGLDLLIGLDGEAPATWAAITADAPDFSDVEAEVQAITREDIACLIYTSGTGGAPKGVMLPHRALMSNCAGARKLVEPLDIHDDIYLSFLPPSHSYEHTVGLYFLPAMGCEIVFSRGADRIAAEMTSVRPTAMTAVPRLFEVIRTRILQGVEKQPGWKQALFHRALAAGLRRLDGQLTFLDRVLDPMLERLVRAKVRERFGGRLKGIMSGGGRLDPEVGRFFLTLGIPIMQGYGQTEAGPVVSANPPGAIRIETVGPPFEGVEVRIADDGEILVRGELVMAGYWNAPEPTARAIVDGWLHTGDVGAFDPDGYLRITDRKKDFIKTSGGEMVAPARIEGLLMAQPEVAQAVVGGDGRSHLVALLVPAEGFDEIGLALAVDRANKQLSVTERVRKWSSVPAFTIENGLLTSTQKIRRPLVLREHAERVARLYS